MIPQLTAQLKYVQVLLTIFKNKCLAFFYIYFYNNNLFEGFQLPFNEICRAAAVMIHSGRTVIDTIPVNTTVNFAFKRDKMTLKPNVFNNSLFIFLQQSV